MGELALLEPDDPRWAETTAAVGADVFYRPGFARFRRESQGHALTLCRFEDELGLVIDVVQLKDVTRLPFFGDEDRRATVDVASPEYNGPLLRAHRPEARSELARRYRAAIERAWAERGVVTEFVRLHPFDVSPDDVEGAAQVNELVWVDLAAGYEAARARMNDGHLRTAKRAARDGATAEIVPADDERIARLASLYLDAMQKRAAKSVYLFDERYFRAMFRQLGEDIVLVESRSPSGSLASMIVLFVGRTHVWYMYGALVDEERNSGANTMLFDRMFAWAAERGARGFVLGGGFEPGDGLFRNKLGWSPVRAPVFHLRRVRDAGRLDELVARKRAFDEARGVAFRTDYFPAYWL